MVPSPKTKTETETPGFQHQDQNQDSEVPRPRPRLVKTGLETSRDQDSSLENSKSVCYSWHNNINRKVIKQIMCETVHLTTNHIKHCHVAVVKPNQQLSFVFSVAQTPRLLVVELMFIDDDATQWKMIVQQQNVTIVPVRYKYVTVRVNGDVWRRDVWSEAEWC